MFKVRVDKSQFTQLELNVRNQFVSILKDKEMLNEVGEFVRDRIVYQARIKKPVSEIQSFPDLSPAWIKRRTELAKVNATTATYSPKRSNLSFTGQLLDSYTYTITDFGTIELEFKGDHRGYLYKNGARGPTIPNESIAQNLKSRGFVVVDRALSRNTQIVARVKSIALTYLRRALRSQVKVG